MPVQAEARRASDAVTYEQPVYSRDVVVLDGTAAHTYRAGHVMGKITSGGKFLERDVAAVDGSEVAVAVLLNDTVVLVGVDKNAVVVARHAAVNRWQLQFEATATLPADRDSAVTELAAVGIVARDDGDRH